MGRSNTFVDSLSYLYDTKKALASAGNVVNSLQKLTMELKAAGVDVLHSLPAKAEGGSQAPSYLTEQHLRVYWEWLSVLDDVGMARLVDLESFSAADVFEHMLDRAADPAEQKSKDLAPYLNLSPYHQPVHYPADNEIWLGTQGGFLPSLKSNSCTPSKSNKVFGPDTDSDALVSLVERGWVRWLKRGGTPLAKADWTVQTRTHAHTHTHTQARTRSDTLAHTCTLAGAVCVRVASRP